ncbi:hypothetical protein [Nonomuraea angiospora]|uniref:hypothetical protein n=1 Tax=Nonomuraea angiospora TaxID=46172 RepID=UPI0029A9E376|nr:hypothetical protein [Nonomuraea angiospora]MDX3107725.1 hypothetical protein [Nonomuraea angiospora]
MSTLYTGAIAVLAAAWTGRGSSGGQEERMAAALDDFLDFALGSRHLYRFPGGSGWTRPTSARSATGRPGGSSGGWPRNKRS